MKRWRRAAAALIFGSLAVLCSYVALNYVTAWYYQAQASRLLLGVRSLQPGVTTVSEAQQALLPSKRYLYPVGNLGGGANSFEAEYGVRNVAAWSDWPIRFASYPVQQFAAHYLAPQWTYLTVTLLFRNGKLESVTGDEAQCPFACGHPFFALATVNAGPPEDAPKWLGPPHEPGYHVEITRLGQTSFNGYALAGNASYRVIVYADAKASPGQREGALDFDLGCFTRQCLDAVQLIHLHGN